jgi:hypothetical protein
MSGSIVIHLWTTWCRNHCATSRCPAARVPLHRSGRGGKRGRMGAHALLAPPLLQLSQTRKLQAGMTITVWQWKPGQRPAAHRDTLPALPTLAPLSPVNRATARRAVPGSPSRPTAPGLLLSSTDEPETRSIPYDIVPLLCFQARQGVWVVPVVGIRCKHAPKS